MLVCICKGLSERAIAGTIREGAHSLEAIGAACGAGTDCGTCQDALEDMIDDVVAPSRLLRARCAEAA